MLHQGEKEVFVDRTGRISLNLKDGMKRITIHLPGSCSVRIANFNIDKDAKVESIKYDKKAMFFGDSITHAAYLDFPSLNYSNIISKRLNMKSINQAIGGDVFDKNHLDFLPDFNPDIVFVAYGTNDWLSENDTCQEKSMEYFSKLVSIYGESKVNVILPIWRGDSCAYPELKNSFHDIRNIIKVNAESKGLNVIDGLDFVPHIEMLFYDKFLHPNEMGFAFYADKLENAVKCCSI